MHLLSARVDLLDLNIYGIMNCCLLHLCCVGFLSHIDWEVVALCFASMKCIEAFLLSSSSKQCKGMLSLDCFYLVL